MNSPDPALQKQYQRYLEADARARRAWEQKDRELRKLVKLAKLGRKIHIVAAISENRGVRITDQFREAMHSKRDKRDKIFAPAFARRHEVKEVPLKEAV